MFVGIDYKKYYGEIIKKIIGRSLQSWKSMLFYGSNK